MAEDLSDLDLGTAGLASDDERQCPPPKRARLDTEDQCDSQDLGRAGLSDDEACGDPQQVLSDTKELPQSSGRSVHDFSAASFEFTADSADESQSTSFPFPEAWNSKYQPFWGEALWQSVKPMWRAALRSGRRLRVIRLLSGCTGLACELMIFMMLAVHFTVVSCSDPK